MGTCPQDFLKMRMQRENYLNRLDENKRTRTKTWFRSRQMQTAHFNGHECRASQRYRVRKRPYVLGFTSTERLFLRAAQEPAQQARRQRNCSDCDPGIFPNVTVGRVRHVTRGVGHAVLHFSNFLSHARFHRLNIIFLYLIRIHVLKYSTIFFFSTFHERISPKNSATPDPGSFTHTRFGCDERF